MPSLEYAGEGIIGSILSANVAHGDFANVALASFLSSLWCHYISAALLFGRTPSPLSSIGMFISSDVLPSAAFLASASALSFPSTPLCPGTHLMSVVAPGWNLAIASVYWCSAFMMYCPGIALSSLVFRIAAWLSRPIM